MGHPAGRLYVLIGLPGSGKTAFLTDTFSKEHPEVLIIDDYQANAIDDQPDPRWSRNRSSAIAALSRGRSVIVSDISYCHEDSLASLVRQMQVDVPGVEVEPMYFENDPVAARHNVKVRARGEADREVALINRFSTVYHPPADAMPITRSTLSKRRAGRPSHGRSADIPSPHRQPRVTS